MKRKANRIRRVLYSVLPLNIYLTLLSKMYFLFFGLGFLKNSKVYAYPYFLKNVIEKGDVCIDIGANMGYLTTLLSKLTGDTGKVYAVEPVKPMLEVLIKNTRRRKNVKILPFALGEENKTIQLGNDTIHTKGFMASGSHTVIDKKDAKVDMRFDAEMKRGSQVFEHLEKLDFIKCDIEGYEVIVLKEMEPVIIKHKPILLIEARNKKRRALIEFFQEREFYCFTLDQGLLVPTTPKDAYDMLVIPIEEEAKFRKFIKATNNS